MSIGPKVHHVLYRWFIHRGVWFRVESVDCIIKAVGEYRAIPLEQQGVGFARIDCPKSIKEIIEDGSGVPQRIPYTVGMELDSQRGAIV